MLEKFICAKRAEIAELEKSAQSGAMPEPWTGDRPNFMEALKSAASPLAVIAEYKRASPSRGEICPTLQVEDVVRQYTSAGARALSILTENRFFMGDFSYLQRASGASPLPVLRKDFIFDSIQIDMTASSPASALLLIVRLTPHAATLRKLREKAESYGIRCVVEIFDDADLAIARDSGATIIQVNARDLDTLQVNRAECIRLIERAAPLSHEVWIAASGMETNEHLWQAANAGYQAALIGTALMENGTPGNALNRILQVGNHTC